MSSVTDTLRGYAPLEQDGVMPPPAGPNRIPSRDEALGSLLGPIWDAGKSVGDMLRTSQFDPQSVVQAAGNTMLGTAGPKLGIFVGPAGAKALQGATHPVVGKLSQGIRFGDKWFGRGGSPLPDSAAEGILKMRQIAGLPEGRDVWNQSGWALDASGKPMKELPDIGSRLEAMGDPTHDRKTGDTSQLFRLAHPAGDIHAVYDMPPIRMTNAPGRGGNYDPATGQITVSGNPLSPSQVSHALSTALHETQHHIQQKEGFAVGSSPVNETLHPEFYTQRGLDVPPNDVREKMAGLESMLAAIGADPSPAALDSYQRVAGEVSARNVQGRRAKGYRYLSHPADTEDVPREQQTVRTSNEPPP